MFQRITVLFLLMAFLLAVVPSGDAASWLDGGPDKLWSTSNNWQFGNNPYNSPITIGNHIDAHNDTTLVNQFYENRFSRFDQRCGCHSQSRWWNHQLRTASPWQRLCKRWTSLERQHHHFCMMGLALVRRFWRRP